MNNLNSDNFQVSTQLDCCGHLCPVPILMTEEKIGELKKGAVLEVAFTDPGAVPDLTAWCRATGQELLGFKKVSPTRFAYIRKKND